MSAPSYFAIIPATVRYDKELEPNAKLLYGEISAMCNVEGFCWAENSYFAELYNVSIYTISRWISKLEKRGHIKSDLNKANGNTRKITLKENVQKGIVKKRNTYCEKPQKVLTKSATQYMRIIQLIIQLIKERKMRLIFLKIIVLKDMKCY